MDLERWRQVERLYHAALEHTAEARGKFIAESCEGDAELRNELESLLAEDLAANGPLDRPAWEGVTSLMDDSNLMDHNQAAHLSFPPGTVLAQRYRVVNLLGHGGMGEVYRADDLLLGQPVALKFLPRAATSDATLRSRFRNEVRTARQVSHPNVCRVYDIGEAEGLTYLTMEYVDGEDLGSLLRRIGKLPEDKALEIARKLCAGLAAAHEKGVIHRDLKPANIMLDGKGQVRITDFGLAGVVEQIRDIRSGTPAYMAPEQHAGKELTLRTDIYALGIVLHELFTGRRPSEGKGSTELDAAVEHVILRCLETDTRMRPPSALSVAAALPGGDPLATALAAGETPSPELVANAGAVEGLRVPVAITCLMAVMVGLAALCFLHQRADLINQTPMENSSDVLAAKAREIAKTLGYTARPVDAVFGWNYDADYLQYADEHKTSLLSSGHLQDPHPRAAVYFWYRASPQYLNPMLDNAPARFDRYWAQPGMLQEALDPDGHLTELRAQPPAETTYKGPPTVPNWSPVLIAAGFDPRQLHLSEPVLTPPAAYDSRAAWTGSLDNISRKPLRIEAAAYERRPVFFRVIAPWTRLDRASPVSFGGYTPGMFLTVVIVVLLSACLLAWRNTRVGRADRRGAFKLASFAFVCMLLSDLGVAHHVPTFAEITVMYSALRDALLAGGAFWVLYLAFEPQVRRQSPATLISWSRLLDGRWRDPLMAGEVLTGLAMGTVAMCVVHAFLNLPFLAILAPQLMNNAREWLSLWSSQAIFGVGAALIYMVLLNFVLLLFRRKWLALLVFPLAMTVIFAHGFNVISTMRLLLLIWLVGYVLTRFGVLTAASLIYVRNVVQVFPLTTNLSAWYAQATIFAIASVLGIAACAFYTTLAGRIPKRKARF
jgi:serine/threonine protein kinase